MSAVPQMVEDVAFTATCHVQLTEGNTEAEGSKASYELRGKMKTA